jgi:outer membrane biosynthesis protein TonB
MDFFLHQKELGKGWNLPVALALVLHVSIFVLSAQLPEFLDRKPILDEIVTVNLISMPEVREQAPAASRPEPPPPESEPVEVEKIEPAKAKVQIAEVPEPAPVETPPVRPVSLKPLKRKVQKNDPEKIAREEARRRQEKEKQQALARARLEEERARQAAEEARAALAAMIRQQKEGSQPRAAGRAAGGREITSIVMKNYLAALHSQMQQYWILPDMKQWDAGLETVVVLYIRKDGSVRKVIEKKSADPFYDQFVMKTIDSAMPLPRLPKMITEDPLEVGFVFRPGELLM